MKTIYKTLLLIFIHPLTIQEPGKLLDIDINVLHQLDVAAIWILFTAAGQFLKPGRDPIEDRVEEVYTQSKQHLARQIFYHLGLQTTVVRYAWKKICAYL